MAKAKTQYVCSECGGISSKWTGQCPACGAWNTLVESVAEGGNNRGQTYAIQITQRHRDLLISFKVFLDH